MDRRNGTESSIGGSCQDDPSPEMILGLIKQEVDEYSYENNNLDNDDSIPEEEEEQIQIPAAKTDSHSKTPEIGSKNSAFLPYSFFMQQPQSLTVLTNLQRGNVQTHTKNLIPEPLSFHERAAKGEIALVDINDTNINILDAHGLSPLMWSSFHGRLTICQMLVDKGAAINFQSIGGESALMYAAANGHVEIISFLLSRGAQVDLTDENGNTALIYATIGNHPRCIAELLHNGASMTRTNELDDSAFSIAVSRNLHAAQHAMEQFLKEYIESNLIQNGS